MEGINRGDTFQFIRNNTGMSRAHPLEQQNMIGAIGYRDTPWKSTRQKLKLMHQTLASHTLDKNGRHRHDIQFQHE